LQVVSPGYPELLESLKARIRASQVRAALAVSRELVLLYWAIGQDILARQRQEGWGTRVMDRRDEPELVLVTCYPFHYIGAAPLRFIVHTHLVSLTPETTRP
jgi:hypothetical protein